jgi:hypothetical protein
MAIDRSKYKNLGANGEQMKEADKKAAEILGKTDNAGRAGYLSIKEGVNVYRIYPPHPEADGGGIWFAQPKATVFLPVLIEERDDEGKVIMENGVARKKEGRKSVFNARIHGPQRILENGERVPVFEKDLVDEYIRIAVKHANEKWPNVKRDEKSLAATEKAAFLSKIYGSFNQKDPKKSIQGLKYQLSWVSYVDEIVGTTKTFGRIEWKKTIKDRFNVLAALENANDPLGTDPFTDIDEGRAVIVTYDKNAVPKTNCYSTDIDSSTIEDVNSQGKKIKVQRTYPLSDQEIENWLKQPPLAKLLENVFTKKDFDLQLEGLERHDKFHKLGIFNSPEFQEVAEEIAGYFVNESDDEQDEEDENSEETSGEKHDQYSVMDRTELKKEIKKRELPITIKSSMSEDDLRAFLREDDKSKADIDEEEVDDEEEEVDDEGESNEEGVRDELPWEKEEREAREQIAQAKKESVADRVAAIRGKVS